MTLTPESEVVVLRAEVERLTRERDAWMSSDAGHVVALRDREAAILRHKAHVETAEARVAALEAALRTAFDLVRFIPWGYAHHGGEWRDKAVKFVGIARALLAPAAPAETFNDRLDALLAGKDAGQPPAPDSAVPQRGDAGAGSGSDAASPASPAAPAETPKCANRDCIDGYVPCQPDGEPEPCPSCRKVAP